MSACISARGEFGRHRNDARFTCTRCHVFDEDAALAEIDRLNALCAPVSRTCRDEIVALFAEHRPSRWRSFTNDAEILRCCGQDFGNPTKRLKRFDDGGAWLAFAGHLAGIAAASGLLRTDADALSTAWLKGWYAASDGITAAPGPGDNPYEAPTPDQRRNP
jgi:hypothetical protein